ncbi:MAG: type II toxin-antitoxin system RelE/ParE family toxin [Candidatus Nanopelagicales bacterium]
MTYRVELTRRARRSLTEELPEAVAAACWEFIVGPLAADPYRVGKPLRDELAGRYAARRGEFRVVYEVHDTVVLVRVIDVRHRRDAYA